MVWFKSELRQYQVVCSSYWVLILSFGFLYGWLITFPLQGPLLEELATDSHDFQVVLLLFLGGHISGLAAAGITGYYFRFILRYFSLGAVPCALLTLLVRNTPSAWWPFVFICLGVFSGLAIISWATAFTNSVLPVQRGRTMAMAAAAAYLILYSTNWLIQWISLQSLFTIATLLLLAMAVMLIYWHHKITNKVKNNTYKESRVNLLSHWPLLPFIFGIYALAGLLYSVIYSHWWEMGHEHELFHIALGVLPYIGFLFFAGTLADIRGRRIDAIIGSVIIGIGFMLFGILSGMPRDASIHVFIIGGFAFLNVFIWLVLADISRGRQVSLYYSVGLAINNFSMFLGVLLGDRVMTITSGSEILTVEIAGLFSFLSIAFIPVLTETLKRSTTLIPLKNAESLLMFFDSANLTHREEDVTKLLVAGISSDEIRQRLHISTDTLKSHLRNIYGKVGVKNRLELTLLMVNELQKTNTPNVDTVQ